MTIHPRASSAHPARASIRGPGTFLERTILVGMIALMLPLASVPARALTDEERGRIVRSVVPDGPFYPSPDMCRNGGGERADRRGRQYWTGLHGVSIRAPSCLVGGEVRGTFPYDLDWQAIKNRHDGDGVRWLRPGPGRVHIIGTYISNVSDAIGPPKSPNTDRRSSWRVEHVYARHVRDDFIENDACLDGEVHDTFVDSTHTFISARPGLRHGSQFDRYRARHTVTNSLIQLSCMTDRRAGNRGSCPAGQSTGILFKTSACSGTLNMRDSIIRVDARSLNGATPMVFPPGNYSNVWLIYDGPKSQYPAPLPDGVTEVDDIELWRWARAKWLDRHGCDRDGNDCRQ